jgi:hypothetical protein
MVNQLSLYVPRLSCSSYFGEEGEMTVRVKWKEMFLNLKKEYYLPKYSPAPKEPGALRENDLPSFQRMRKPRL